MAPKLGFANPASLDSDPKNKVMPNEVAQAATILDYTRKGIAIDSHSLAPA